jgi:hypothetical protein
MPHGKINHRLLYSQIKLALRNLSRLTVPVNDHLFSRARLLE